MNATRDPRSLNRLLSPSSVALVGISGDAEQPTTRPLKFMRAHGFNGRIYLVNPSRSAVLGEQCYASLMELPEAPDVAFVMVAAKRVCTVIDDCARAGVGHAIVYAGGFSEDGVEGKRRQDELLSHAQQAGVRLLGPNSIGVANMHTGAIVSVNAVFEMDHLPIGGASLVSQSGSMMGSLASRAAARGIGFSKSVSVGNEADISVGEVVEALVDDERTQVILLFLETIRDRAALSHALNRARAARKPVVAYKLGRSEAGDSFTISHTGAIAGDIACIDAFFRRYGVMRVDLLETLLEIAPLAQRYGRTATALCGRRVAIVSTSGGAAAIVADNLALRGFRAVAPPPETIERLGHSGLKIKAVPIIDLTLSATREQYRDVLRHLLESDWCDAVVAVVGSSAQFYPDFAVRPLIESSPYAAKPLVAFLAPEASDSLVLLLRAGVPAFRTPESCADALSAFLSRADEEGPDALPFEWPADLPTSGMLTENEAFGVFESLGIPIARRHHLTASDSGHSLPYPVVAKISSRGIAHKTDVGGVVTGISSEVELRQAVEALLTNARAKAPYAHVDGVLVQTQEHGQIELVLGFRDDSVVGPVVVLGAGGTTAELMDDIAVRVAPVSESEAREMIRELRVSRLIDGYRGQCVLDATAIAKAVAAISRLACVNGATVAEAEINPLFVRANGVIAVDALLRLADTRDTEQSRES